MCFYKLLVVSGITFRWVAFVNVCTVGLVSKLNDKPELPPHLRWFLEQYVCLCGFSIDFTDIHVMQYTHILKLGGRIQQEATALDDCGWDGNRSTVVWGISFCLSASILGCCFFLSLQRVLDYGLWQTDKGNYFHLPLQKQCPARSKYPVHPPTRTTRVCSSHSSLWF